MTQATVAPKRGTKRERMLERIARHGENLKRVFGLRAEVDGDKLARKLRRLEAEGAKYAQAIDTAPGLSETEQGAREAELLAKVDKVLGFSAKGIPVFINTDWRGYALKIDSEWTQANAADFERDWGGFGLLAPDLSQE